MIHISAFFTRTAIFGTWRHNLMIILIHGLMNVRRTWLLLTMSAKDVHIMCRLLQMLQFTTAVYIVAAMYRMVVRAHPLDNETILDHLIHIRFFLMQTLLQFVIRLLNKS